MGMMKRLAEQKMFRNSGRIAVKKKIEPKKKSWCQIESDSGDNSYIVSKSPRGKVSCTCPHYQMRLKSQGKLCKHAIKALAERLI